MNWFSNLKIGKKLGMAFAIVQLLMIALGVFSIVQLSKVNGSMVDIVNDWLPSVRLLGLLKYDASAVRRDTLNYVATTDKKRHYEQKINGELESLIDDQKKYEPLITSDEERGFYRGFQAEWDKYKAVNTRVMELAKQNKTAEAVRLAQSEGSRSFEAASKYLQDDVDLNDKGAKNAANQAAASYSSSRYWIIGLLGCSVALGIVVATSIARSLAGSATSMLEMIEQVAGNNLAINDMQVKSQDEIGRAGLALNRMKNNLREVIQTIAGTAEHVASASEEISASANQQSQGAETQKDQATQVATAMQEMSSTVLQVSENSNKAAEASRRAAETARHGGAIVQETLGKMQVIAESVGSTARKMEELGKRSDEIGRIIAVIDDIADQTNLLALNAAIEAARAGEQGRGFAVVADEVRKLAERTTTATKEIASMIKNIQDETKSAVVAMEAGSVQVEEGVKSTAQAGESLKEIIQMAEEVGEMITHIATAATEQSAASEEVNQNMDQIAKLVKESAIGAQQSAKACQDLSGLALDLQKMVGNFDLDGRDRHSSGRSHPGGNSKGHGDEESSGSSGGQERSVPEKALAAAR